MVCCRNRGARFALARNFMQTANVWITDNRAKIMKQDNGTIGLILGGLVALAAVIFIFSGGELGGKTVINGDEDLPPIAAADPN
jgi:predicted methyltransferase